jgi:hypothetical protein
VAQVYVFGDEAGDLVFTKSAGVSRYFILGTVTMHDCAIGMELLNLRRELALRGHFTLSEFHAKNDKWRVRDLVFDVMRRSQIRIHLTILDKTKTQDQLRAAPLRFYKGGLVSPSQVRRASNRHGSRRTPGGRVVAADQQEEAGDS